MIAVADALEPHRVGLRSSAASLTIKILAGDGLIYPGCQSVTQTSAAVREEVQIQTERSPGRSHLHKIA